MNFLFKVMFIIILMTNISSSNTIIDSDNKKIIMILTRENIDLDTKSIRGWMRVFNSQSKLLDYEIFVSNPERKLILKYLDNLYEIEYKKHSKVVR